MSIFYKCSILLLPTLLFCEKIHYNKSEIADKRVHRKIQCRWVCDKKLYREKEIAKAVSFYKNSKYYKFEIRKF